MNDEKMKAAALLLAEEDLAEIRAMSEEAMERVISGRLIPLDASGDEITRILNEQLDIVYEEHTGKKRSS